MEGNRGLASLEDLVRSIGTDPIDPMFATSSDKERFDGSLRTVLEPLWAEDDVARAKSVESGRSYIVY
jgi:hypothetical protein